MIKKLFKTYIVDALSHMAMGLFCSLILGLIIGLAIAHGLKCDLLVMISSAIVGAVGYQFGGPVSTLLFKMTNSALGAGMGTAGLVGPLAAYANMSEAGDPTTSLIIKIVCLYFIAPALISLGIHLLMKKMGLIKPGDFKLED